jgi:hypothetical protein
LSWIANRIALLILLGSGVAVLPILVLLLVFLLKLAHRWRRPLGRHARALGR